MDPGQICLLPTCSAGVPPLSVLTALSGPMLLHTLALFLVPRLPTPLSYPLHLMLTLSARLPLPPALAPTVLPLLPILLHA